uniref:Uncharacterized protein n=1 Tax=Rhizophagus irregularis (strain DAOM 181602 / DAOM 197198 / MUCL 43194) TaxID=747089 RepID=U9UMJ2_RHIID
MQNYQSFTLQCQYKISGKNNSLSNTIFEKQKQRNELATQEVEDALAFINKLKNILEETRVSFY